MYPVAFAVRSQALRSLPSPAAGVDPRPLVPCGLSPVRRGETRGCRPDETLLASLPRRAGERRQQSVDGPTGSETLMRSGFAIDGRHIGGVHALVLAGAAIEYRVDGHLSRRRGDVEGQVVV